MIEDGNSFKLGITDYAREQLGDIMFLKLPDEGTALGKGQPFGDIEGVKAVYDLISPVEGKVLRVNKELLEEPGSIQSAPYESWLIQAGIDFLPGDLMDEETYISCHT